MTECNSEFSNIYLDLDMLLCELSENHPGDHQKTIIITRWMDENGDEVDEYLVKITVRWKCERMPLKEEKE